MTLPIPIHTLSPETLRNVVESFVTREGTDYGDQERTLGSKIDQVLRQLETGTATLVYDEESDSCNIVPTERQPRR